jgi:hypothetical protein
MIIKVVQSDETFDLCAACEDEFREFLTPPEQVEAPKRKGRPPKEDRTQVQ